MKRGMILIFILILTGFISAESDSSLSPVEATVNIKTDSICGDSTCDTGEDCSNCPGDCGNCQTPGGSGSNSGGGSRTKADFQINPEEIIVSISKGEIQTSSILIKNTGKKNLQITAETTPSLQNFINLEENTFNLNIEEEKEIEIKFKSLGNVLEDLYVGKIIFKSSGIEKYLFIALEIESLDSLFDVKINVLDKIISPGKDIKNKIEIMDIGGVGPVNATIENIIKNSEGNIIAEKTDTKTIENSLIYTETLQIPANTPAGTYFIYTKIFYNGKTAIASDTFEIKKQISFWLYLILIILGIIVCYLYSKRKKPKKKH